jgi:hypothetical protein
MSLSGFAIRLKMRSLVAMQRQRATAIFAGTHWHRAPLIGAFVGDAFAGVI